jgi:hypothetical protein
MGSHLDKGHFSLKSLYFLFQGTVENHPWGRKSPMGSHLDKGHFSLKSLYFLSPMGSHLDKGHFSLKSLYFLFQGHPGGQVTLGVAPGHRTISLPGPSLAVLTQDYPLTPLKIDGTPLPLKSKSPHPKPH